MANALINKSLANVFVCFVMRNGIAQFYALALDSVQFFVSVNSHARLLSLASLAIQDVHTEGSPSYNDIVDGEYNRLSERLLFAFEKTHGSYS